MKDWRTESRLFLLPKDGSTQEECEDAAAADDGVMSYAVADGATEAFDAGRWARRLAAGWVGAQPAPVKPVEFSAWVAAQGEWLEADWGEAASLPWYAQEKRRAGSFAAFVCLSFDAGREGPHWRSAALGDSCLFQLRGGSIVAALPIASHADFNSSPPLVPSLGALREAALARAVFREGSAERGDTFLLLSDALAAWFFETHDRRVRERLAEFDSLAAAAENESLAELVRRERREGRLKDDDVAVVRVSVVGE
jgi:Protein phosphatase 2C